MHLLRKNLILAGILSIAIAGFIGSSSASALEGFSFEDIINGYRNRTEQSQSSLLNPLGSDSGSAISRNETSFPNLLFNGTPGNTTWGHDGKGLIFVDNDNLVDNNPQLATAKRGDTLKYSMEIEPQRYNGTAETDPVPYYTIYATFYPGLIVDMDSIVVKVDDQVVDLGENAPSYMDEDDLGSEISILDGANSLFYYELQWQDSEGNFLYGEDAVINITYSATISQDAPSEVWSRGVYYSGSSSVDYAAFQSTEHQATAMIDGNILIRRVDANGAPLAGAKYTVDGVKANIEDEANNIYVYDENGDTEVFVTGEDGSVIIRKLPIDTYAINELSSPNGHEPQQKTMTRANYENVEEIEFGPTHYVFNLLVNADLTGYIGKTTMDDGRTIISNAEFNEALGDEPADGSRLYTYDDETQTYKNGSDSTTYIVKTQDGYRFHGEGGYRAPYNPYSINSIHDNSTDEDLVLFDYTTALGTNVAKRDFGLEILGSQAILHDSGETQRLFYDDNEDCYKDSTGKTIVRKTDSGYRMEEGGSSLSYKYNQDAGMYTSDSIMEIYAIREVSDTQLAAYPYFTIDYSPEFDHYYTGFSIMTKQRILTETRDSLRASIVLFRDRATNDAAPEAIPNPQTSDTIAKAACIILITTASGFAITRKLSRR